MKRAYFGTDGVRGPYGGPVINPIFAERLAFAAASWSGCRRVLIGRDTRASGSVLRDAVARGFARTGCEVTDLGVLPTPAVAREVRQAGESVMGVVITASHNPASDNGIKFFGYAGRKFSDADELAIEAKLPEALPDFQAKWTESSAALENYRSAMVRLLPEEALEGWKVVCDTANGATVHVTPRVIQELGASVVEIGNEPDGDNINRGVGSEHPEQLTERVRAESARIGIAHDGDGDRVIVCDEAGQIVDGDEILTILATDAMQRGELAENTLVITQQSNLGVDAALRTMGGAVRRTDIGDRYVAEEMRATGAILGGESSGHIICRDIGPTGDGLAAAMKLLDVMLRTNQPLSVLRQRLTRFPQLTGTVKVSEKPPLESCAALSAVMKSLATELGESGRLLVRYSGTEPKLRLLVEGPDDATVANAYARLQAAAEEDLT